MDPHSLKIDVTGRISPEITQGKSLSVAVWLFTPERMRLDSGGRPTVVTLLHGGTYDKRYFHAQVPGRNDYSLAEYLSGRGYFVVLPDILGIGDSSRAPQQMQVTRQIAALANAAAMEQLYDRLRHGDLVPGLPPIAEFHKVGGGHSLGGMQIITEQAEFRTYEKLLILGYTAAGVEVVVDGKARNTTRPLDYSKPDYSHLDRVRLRPFYHWEDVPEEVIAYDDTLDVAVPYILRVQGLTTGIVVEDAAKIDVPIYLCLSERDVAPDPYREPSYFRSSPDITLHFLRRSAHCHVFASTRFEMFSRMDSWMRSLER